MIKKTIIKCTGRTVLFGPDLQNIPIRTDEGQKLRRVVIEELGNKLVGADYSQLEARLGGYFDG